MLASFFSWWTTRIIELLPPSWTRAGAAAADGIVVDTDQASGVAIALRRKGNEQALTLVDAARLAGRNAVWLRAPAEAVLEKRHVVPAASRRELDRMLRYELARITPFQAADLFWRWDSHPKAGDKTRLDVTLTLVPRIAVATALEVLAKAGIEPRFIEAGPPERPRLLAVEGKAGQAASPRLTRGLACACGFLALVVLGLPVLMQERALLAADSAIDALQPAIKQVEALRRGISADGAGRTVLAQEMERTGDVLHVLATVTRILPDDTYLTDFSLRERQMVVSGRSAAAARLITGLSADPTIRDATFAAPVTRVEGATTDVFSIRAGVAP